jgi:hypothetical protein
MQTTESQEIVKRFFEALKRLKAMRVIRGKQTFTARYNINRWNFNTCEKEPARDIFQPAWLTYLVRDYGVGPLWLLTGEGDFILSHKKDCCKSTATKVSIDVSSASQKSLQQSI